jgi:NitT/TauT family transport system ATP-binding protein
MTLGAVKIEPGVKKAQIGGKLEQSQNDQGKMNPSSPRGQTVIEGQGVSKLFGETVVALDGATFNVRKQQFISLVGPSGCGKSTLLRMISGLIPVSSGTLELHGELVQRPRPDVGMMFQKPTLLAWRTILENVLLPTELSRKVTAEDRDHALELLELVGLADFAFSFPSQLSGGMQQRAALARLLQTGADVLLLDEPFGALDEFTRERLNVELLRIVEKFERTTLFVTHNIQEAIFLADQVFVMTPRPGRIAAVIDVPFERPRDPELMQSVPFNDLVGQVRKIFGNAAH